MTAFIAYLRVSTDRQGKSGLGLEAQQEAVARFAHGDTILETFVEVESGRHTTRPHHAAAISKCRQFGAVLLIAKLDRLARDVAFIAALMKSDVHFLACDMPEADPFRLHIEAAIAEEEARKISARTKAALAAARARGVRLGGFRGRAPSDGDRIRSASMRRSAALQRAANLRPLLEELRQSGAATLQALAYGLNRCSIPAPRGGEWSPVQVSRLIKAVEMA